MDVTDWLLDADPSIRWQVMGDLLGEPDDVVAAERARVATEGWARGILALRHPEYQWGASGSYSYYHETPDGSTVHALTLLREMGIDPADDDMARAVTAIDETLTHYNEGQRFFDGEVEACINGRVLAAGAYFGRPSPELAARLVSEQLEDGGWNCDAPPSLRSSFHSTICVLEGLLVHERTHGVTGELTAARQRGEEYLLERRLLRSFSTGEVVDPAWTEFSYPPGWHYDVLRALDHLRDAGADPTDARIGEAVDLVEERRGDDGRWPLRNPHPDQVQFDIGDRPGEPSRWNTLRALRVLEWAGRGD